MRTMKVGTEPSLAFWKVAEEFETAVVYDADEREVARFGDKTLADAIVNIQQLATLLATLVEMRSETSSLRRALDALAEVGISIDVSGR